MRSEEEIIDMLANSIADAQKEIGFSVRNGQATEAYRKTLAWVLK